MKKFLMTGIAALAMCAAFTSCSKDIEQISQEDLNRIEAQKIVDNYNQAFIKTFGQPAANQDWGFGTGTRSSFTRAADPGDYGAYFSGSSEKQSDYYKAMGLVAPDMVSEDEENFVTNWLELIQILNLKMWISALSLCSKFTSEHKNILPVLATKL